MEMMMDRNELLKRMYEAERELLAALGMKYGEGGPNAGFVAGYGAAIQRLQSILNECARGSDAGGPGATPALVSTFSADGETGSEGRHPALPPALLGHS